MATSPEELENLDRIENFHTNIFHLVENRENRSSIDPKIALLKLKKEKKLWKVKHIARSAGLPSGLNDVSTCTRIVLGL